MRVLFSVSAWPGHYYPMVPLGRRLLAGGHELRVLCAPSQATAVTAAGLPPVPALDGLDMVLQARLSHYWQAQAGAWPYPFLPPHPVTGVELASLADFDFPAYRRAHRAAALAATTRSFDAAVATARQWRPDVVVHDRLSLEGLLAARVVDVPAVLHLWGPVGIDEPGELRLMPGDPTGSFARYGVADPTAATVDHVADPCPERLRPPVGAATRLDVRYSAYAGPLDGEPPADLTRPGERTRVCVVWGTSVTAMVGPRSFVVPELVEALARLDVEVVVLLGAADRERLSAAPGRALSCGATVAGRLPGRGPVRVLTDVPLARVLPGCAAVVHHGGAGCVMTAVAAGVPQLAVTFAGEQAANAARIAAAGAGRHLPGADFQADAAGAMVRELLTDRSYREAAGALRDQHERRPDPDALVTRLATLAG
ncbi:nucleotide disphospho-sugar-binding domain-containing protein [Micromonospora sp. NPDC050980]|uniref:nucleotide disphospho-sugar-binding domain-containing protein n=1 Tax=Micromonospora sp. NPDC050980 TaxID=3155161 RepID=UPI003408D05D